MRFRLLFFVAVAVPFLAGCSDSSTGPSDEPDPPRVSAIARAELPEVPAEQGVSARCYNGPDVSQGLSDNCPVLLWDGYAYWPLSYSDNRLSVGIAVFDDEGDFIEVIEAVGARYIWDTTVDEDLETVTFRGQDDRTVEIGWAALAQ